MNRFVFEGMTIYCQSKKEIKSGIEQRKRAKGHATYEEKFGKAKMLISSLYGIGIVGMAATATV